MIAQDDDTRSVVSVVSARERQRLSLEERIRARKSEVQGTNDK